MKHGPQFSNTDNALLVIARIALFVFAFLSIMVWLFSCKPQEVKDADLKLETDQKQAAEFRKISESNNGSKIRDSLAECSDVLRSKSIDIHKLRIENSQLREQRDELQADLDDAQTAIWFYRGFWAIVIGAGILGILSVLVKIGLIKLPL